MSTTLKISLKRVLAFLIDWVIIFLYAVALYTVSMFIVNKMNIQLDVISPIYGQLVGFVSLTLPVFLYFFLSERSTGGGTLGKRLMRIQVALNTQGTVNSSIFYRNLLKFLPWEIAHAGVHWLIYYSENSIEPPLWIWILLILPQIIVVVYLISIVGYGGKQSIYDRIAQTQIKQVGTQQLF